ncbi:hypothetical protein [Corynebacterium sp. AOP12-C2-36]|uniref:hypothetical protein n=1 Tax=Corynebacterium sp. AOP12-C2-36 TaxID=3457723 RepID=UPI004034A4EF
MTTKPHQSWQARIRRYAVSLAAAGLLSAPLVLASTGSALADQETPAERCQRQTAEYNTAMETAWRAAHPGKEPTGNEWPPYICRDIPTPTLPPGPPPGGGNGGGEPAPERTHQYEGFDRPDGEYRQDMALGTPRTGLADRMGTGEPTDTTRPSAGDTARSNVREVTPWTTTVTDDSGNPRDVRVVDTPDGPAVITDNGTATGEILTTDTDSGVTSVTRQDRLEGRQLTDRNSSNDRGDRDDTDDTSRAASTSAAVPAPGVDDTADEAAGGGGDNETGGLPVGPLGAGGALAGAAGAILADRRRRDGAHRGDINWGNGREQSLILLEGVDSPREHRFAMDVPEGGQMVKNPDGSVDVLDADGNVVEHVKAPWAYDASGRPVETYYEVDNETGELVQIVDPDRTTLLPILADPDKEKKDGVGIVDTTGRSDGDTWTEDLGNGETATHTIPEGTGGQTVDTRIEREDGTFTDTRSVQNDVGGWDAWSNNDDGTSAYAQSNQDDGTHYSEHYDTAPTPQAAVQPDVTSQGNADNSQGTVVADNPDGTQSYGDYQRTGDNQYEMQVDNPNGTTSDIQSTQRDDAGVSTQVDDQDGSRVSTDGETVVPLDEAGNDVTGNQEPDANTGRFYDTDTGEWVNGAVIGGVPVRRGDDGKLTDTDGNPVTVESNSETGEPEVSVTDPSFGASDVAGGISGAGTDAAFGAAEESAKRVGSEADDLLRASRWGSGALSAVGAVAGAEIDRQQGMPAAEAYASNIGGGLAGAGAAFVTGAAIAGAVTAAPAVLTVGASVAVGTAVTIGVTKGIQKVWSLF